MRSTLLRWMLASAPATDERPLADAIDIAGPVECLDAQRLAAKIALWAEQRSIAADTRILVHHAPDRLVVRIHAAATEVVREFAPPPTKCSDVETAVAVLVAMALDTTAVEARLADVAPPRSRPRPRAEPPVPTPPPSVAVDRGPSVWIGAALGGSAHVLPRPAVETAVDVELRWRAVAVRAGLDGGFAWRMPIGPPPGSVSAARIGVHGLVCAPIERAALRVAICGGLAGGPYVARPRRISAPQVAIVGWLAGVAGLELGVRLDPRVELVLAAHTIFAAIRPRIEARDAATGSADALAMPRVGGRGLVGVRVRVGARSARSRARKSP